MSEKLINDCIFTRLKPRGVGPTPSRTSRSYPFYNNSTGLNTAGNTPRQPPTPGNAGERAIGRF